jgi:hypothetical protein
MPRFTQSLMISEGYDVKFLKATRITTSCCRLADDSFKVNSLLGLPWNCEKESEACFLADGN